MLILSMSIPAFILTYVDILKDCALFGRENGLQSYRSIGYTTTRLWHDNLREFSTVRTNLHGSRRKVIEKWKEFGDVFGLKPGIDITTLHAPSTPSGEPRYWKITQQCYYGPCICSMPLVGKINHVLRVCKGCYRVLYCNRRCQSL